MPLMLKIVVCLLIPTSNHNPVLWYWFQRVLYAFWFLHQTTTGYHRYWELKGCMPFDSYIKPQHQLNCQTANGVVCLLIPTSNHNLYLWAVFVGSVVCLLIPTSNHNAWAQKNKRIKLYAFWFLHQTTTPGRKRISELSCMPFDSYIKPQLDAYSYSPHNCCMSFDSYIKPQLCSSGIFPIPVVCLLIPTSNHNKSFCFLS